MFTNGRGEEDCGGDDSSMKCTTVMKQQGKDVILV